MSTNDLESLLRDLKPAPPSARLFQKVDEELSLDMSWLGRPSLTRKAAKWFTPVTFSMLGAAAAVAVMSWFAFSQPAQSDRATADGAVPVSTISEWQDFQNEGIRYSQDKTPQRQIRLIGTERRIFIDPRDGAQIIVETPKEESVVLPVNFQ